MPANRFGKVSAYKITADETTVKEISTPVNPASGYRKIYPKSDGKWYVLNSSGVEVELVPSPVVVSCKYYHNSAINWAQGDPTPFTTQIWDTHNAWNGSLFTCPVAGYYKVDVIRTSTYTNYGAGSYWQMDILSNGIGGPNIAYHIQRMETSALVEKVIAVTGVVYLTVGQYIKVQTGSNAGGVISAGDPRANHICIHKIG